MMSSREYLQVHQVLAAGFIVCRFGSLVSKYDVWHLTDIAQMTDSSFESIISLGNLSMSLPPHIHDVIYVWV